MTPTVEQAFKVAMPAFVRAFFGGREKCRQERRHSRPEARSTVGGRNGYGQMRLARLAGGMGYGQMRLSTVGLLNGLRQMRLARLAGGMGYGQMRLAGGMVTDRGARRL